MSACIASLSFAGGPALRPDRGADRQDHRPREDPRRQEGRPPQDRGRPPARDDHALLARDQEAGAHVGDLGAEAAAGGRREGEHRPQEEAGNGHGRKLAAAAASTTTTTAATAASHGRHHNRAPAYWTAGTQILFGFLLWI